MTDEVPNKTEEEKLAASLIPDIAEMERVEKLTNQQLVEEIFERVPYGAHDWLIQEACTRLDPDWAKRAQEAEGKSDV